MHKYGIGWNGMECNAKDIIDPSDISFRYNLC